MDRLPQSVYKRTLPSPPATALSSIEGMRLFGEAMSEGGMNGFFKLIEQFHTQAEPAFCGLASLAMVLNAMSIDPKRTWKTPWRWYDESLLECCKPLELIKQEGVTLSQVGCLARCNGLDIKMHYQSTVSLEEFRKSVEACCKTAGEHMIVSYSRQVVSQTGTGHFSPIGGYHAKQDLVLVLDTARFKYPPHWLPLELLFKAMAEEDEATGKTRGYLILQPSSKPISIHYTLSLMGEWSRAWDYIRLEAPEIIKQLTLKLSPVTEIVQQLTRHCPLESAKDFISVHTNLCECIHSPDQPTITELKNQLYNLPLFKVRSRIYVSVARLEFLAKEICKYLIPSEGRETTGECVTVLLLLLALDKPLEGHDVVQSHPDLLQLMDLSGVALVKDEISFLGYQLINLIESDDLPSTPDCSHCCDSTNAQFY